MKSYKFSGDNLRRLVYLFPFLLLFLSCANTPQSTAEKMREKACHADAAGFFSYIDKSKVAENLRNQVFTNKEAPTNEWQALGQAMAEGVASKMLDQIWQAYESEIKKGKDSNFCKMKILSSNQNAGRDEVLIESPNGQRQIWSFTKYENRWVMTAFHTTDEKKTAPSTGTASSQSQPESEPTEGDYDFRKIKWGMTRDQIKATEKGNPTSENESEVDYLGSVAGLQTLVGYVFAEHKLVQGGYIFQEPHSDDNLYIQDYNKIKGILQGKYGEPKQDKVIWKNDLYKDDPSHYGMAVCIGHLVYDSEWQTQTTKIQLMLSGDNFKCSLMAVYSSIELQGLKEKAQQKREREGL